MTTYHDAPNIYPRDVVLKVVDLNRSLAFYQNIMGLKKMKEIKDGHVLTADGRTPLVTITTGPEIKPKLERRTGLYHFAVLLPDRTSLGLFLKNLVSQNYPLSGGAYHGVSEAVYLQDPDDNGIEIYTDTPEESWDRNDDSINMVTQPLDFEELIALAEGNTWTGAPSDTVLGHMHLHVGDLEKTYEFYRALGFEVTQHLRQQVYFVSTGGYHHHIGFNIWNGRDAAPQPEGRAGMKYFTLKFPSREVMDEAVHKLKEAGYPVTKEGEALYARDPSENFIKFID